MRSPKWSERWGKDKICPITQSRLRPGSSRDGIPYTIQLSCNHRFYRKALIHWMLTQKTATCPLCREPIIKLSNQ